MANNELQGKIEYDPELEEKLTEWIIAHCGSEVGRPEAGKVGFHTWVKDGCVLSQLINSLLVSNKPIKINKSTMPFKQMEQIGLFLSAVEMYGVPRTDMCKTIDIYEGKDLAAVQGTLMALERKATLKGQRGINVEVSQENRREFSDEQLNEGKNVIGLQMGSNRGASQAGMTPYGLGRQIAQGYP